MIQLLTKQKETHRRREQTYGCWEEGTVRESDIDMYTLLYLKWITNKDLPYSTWNSAQCSVAAWMGEEFEGEWIHVYVGWARLLSTWQLSQDCLSAVLQCNIKTWKKKRMYFQLLNISGQYMQSTQKQHTPITRNKSCSSRSWHHSTPHPGYETLGRSRDCPELCPAVKYSNLDKL